MSAPDDLYPYQEIGRDFLATRNRAYLGDEPGSGKTVMACRAMVMVRARRPLVICQASMVPVWRAEWLVWGDPTITLSVLSYSKLVADAAYRRAISQVKPDVVVLDEAHAVNYVTAARTKFIIGDGTNKPMIDSLPSLKYLWLLSGTPAPNTPFDLHHLLRQLWPDRLKTHSVWRSDAWLKMFTWYPGYKKPGSSYEPKPRITGMTDAGADKLAKILKGIMLERTLESVGHELPELDMRVTPLRTQLDLSVLTQEGADRVQVSKARRELGEAKAEIVAKILIDELSDTDHKIIVFAHHRSVLNTLQKALDQFGLVRLDGDSSESDRTEARELFQGDKSVRVFLGQNDAAGTGLTLTAACQVVLVEPSWVPDANLQMVKRAHRIGQTQPVFARLFTAGGTLDDEIIRTNTRKSRATLALASARTVK